VIGYLDAYMAQYRNPVPPWWEEAEACPCAGRCPACSGHWADEPYDFDAGL
jgi:hypothetical protein